MTPSTPAGIVLFAHGSRDPLWRQPMDAVAHRIRQIDPGAVVACAFLELTTPDLPTAVHDLVTQGARSDHHRCRCSWAWAAMPARIFRS
jgi:sirohydrochlorin ferrochelatase